MYDILLMLIIDDAFLLQVFELRSCRFARKAQKVREILLGERQRAF